MLGIELNLVDTDDTDLVDVENDTVGEPVGLTLGLGPGEIL